MAPDRRLGPRALLALPVRDADAHASLFDTDDQLVHAARSRARTTAGADTAGLRFSLKTQGHETNERRRRAMNAAEHQTHATHPHQHSATCGHVSLSHSGHADYLHDGHRHQQHEAHWDECKNTAHAEHASHDHVHAANCGHSAVKHEGHDDYVHDAHRHAAHERHWDEH
jgi:hypothetical protein